MVYRVAIIGAGPAGFYATAALLKKYESSIQVDLFDKLPAPYGLVRYGVAPDHEKIKNVRRVFDRSGEHASFRLFCNVEYGKDIFLDDLLSCYDHVVFAVGCQSARKLGIPGEDSPRVLSATEFVYWYNGHPEYLEVSPDFSGDTAVVVGAGNVALDVARILIRDLDELKRTDIANHAIVALEKSAITDVHILARRGPAQIKFTTPELKEFGELENVQALVMDDEMQLDPDSEEVLESESLSKKLYGILDSFDRVPNPEIKRRVHFRFLVSPTQFSPENGSLGSSLELCRNRLEKTESGYLNAIPTDAKEQLDCGLVVPSVGYRGNELEGLPFDQSKGRIPNIDGRVDASDGRVYVVGWAKRGPSGVVGTNKADAANTVDLMLEDLEKQSSVRTTKDILDILPNGHQSISFEEWQKIKAEEERLGALEGRPRIKFTELKDFLDLL